MLRGRGGGSKPAFIGHTSEWSNAASVGFIFRITYICIDIVMTTALQMTFEKDLAKFKPFLKWAGGKTQLLSSLLPLVPKNFGKYIEPFMGAGGLFFALGHCSAIIADSKTN